MLLAAAMILAAPIASAGEPSPSGPVAWAVLKAPLPAGAPAGCSASARDDGTVRAELFTPGGAACAAARVGEEYITLADLAETLAMSHGAAARVPGAPQAPGGLAANVDRALSRLVELRLVSQEAREMGLLDDVADAKKALEEFEATSLRSLLERRATADVRPDDAEVERLLREAVREWRLLSVLFPKKADAAAFRRSVRGAGSFERLVRAAIAAKKAEGTGEPEWVRAQAMLPQLRAAVARLKSGGMTPAVAVEKGFVVARLDGVRYPDSAEAREAARRTSLERQRFAALERYHAALVRKHAQVDRDLVRRLDLEAKVPGLEALRADARVLVRFSSGPPLLVSDLVSAVAKKFFHGMERPIEERRVNARKDEVFESMLRERVAALEAAAQKLADTSEHRRAMAEYGRAVAFSTFLEKVLVPGVNVTEQEVKRHFDEHQAEYADPQMYRLDGLAFSSAPAAAAGAAKLRDGTDLGWLRANAEGQAKDAGLPLDGRTVSASTFGPALRGALAGATKGAVRVHEEGGVHYVIRVLDELPARVRPYAQARDAIAKQLFADRVTRSLHEYTEALRKANKVEIFVVRIEN